MSCYVKAVSWPACPGCLSHPHPHLPLLLLLHCSQELTSQKSSLQQHLSAAEGTVADVTAERDDLRARLDQQQQVGVLLNAEARPTPFTPPPPRQDAAAHESSASSTYVESSQQAARLQCSSA
jgi:hypothetical protein